MTFKSIIEKIQAALDANPVKGVPEVALYVAALDGKILPEEIEAYRALAAKCKGYDGAKAEEALHNTLRSAGYLLALAVPGVSTSTERIDTFVAESLKVLSKDFVRTLENARFGVTLWTAMAIADGEFAGIEAEAITALKKRLAADYLQDGKAVAYGAGVTPELVEVFSKDIGERVAEFLRTDDLAAARQVLGR